jgi:uracil-DNA glycosylase
MNDINIEESWKQVLTKEFNKPYFHEIQSFLINERQNHRIYPSEIDIFNAFTYTPFKNVKVVILGQDPYHGPGQAHGLSFSVPEGIKPPPSLINIFKELQSDIGMPIPKSGNLEKWAQQGVLLLNATLSVRASEAGSHQKKGWELFTDMVIKTISEQKSGVIFLLWGRYAHAKEQLIDTSKHYLLKAAHPSPLSAYNGFWGCKHFSKTNELLEMQNHKPIDWKL